MINKLAAIVTAFAALVVLLSLGMPQFPVTGNAESLYIGFNETDPAHPTASIVHTTKTVSIGVQPPFVPICIVDLVEKKHQIISQLPTFSVTLGAWTTTERFISVRLIDAQNKDDPERHYWHFPARGQDDSLDPKMQDLVDQMESMDLPNNMGEEFKQNLDRIFERGEPISQERRNELLALAIGAMKESQHEWGAEMLETHTSSTISHSGSGFGRVLAFLGVSLLLSILVGILTWLRIQRQG